MSTMSHNANMISVRTTPELESRAEQAASMVGLKISDLVRIGLTRLSDDILATGRLSLTRPTPKKRKGGGK